jgi:hypothetical protein
MALPFIRSQREMADSIEKTGSVLAEAIFHGF